MEKKKYFNTKLITTTAILLSIEIVLQILGNYIVIPGGFANLNFSLIIIALGAILYGPYVGGALGIVMGIVVLFAPSTAIFFGVNATYTVFICLFKTGLAGLISGFVFKGFSVLAQNKEKKLVYYYIGIITASLLVPLINTSIFILSAPLAFKELFGNFVMVISAVLTTNFLIEFLVSTSLSPTISYIIKILTKETNMGFSRDLDIYN